MKKVTLSLFILAASFAVSQTAHADTFSYNLTSADNSIILNATFTADAVSPGSEDYAITDMTGTFTDTNSNIFSESIVVLTQTIGPSGTLELSPDGLFLYDNLLDPDGLDPNFQGSVLDPTGGVVFYVSDGTEVSISGATSGFYFTYESPDGTNINPSVGYLQEFVPSTVPEPSSLVLMASGLLTVGGFLKRSRNIA